MKQDEHRPLIMVVDDDPDSLSILARHIRREKLTVVEASSGSECLHVVKQHHPDVILLDLMMPEMDGFTLCRALRADPATAEIPVIMLTARDDVDARAQGMALGISDFIAKPATRRELAERIHAQLEMLAADRANFATLDQLEHSKLDRKA
ncbi:MAG: response regulator [Deltaproteobacteria bacterium]|nr:response regulator [Deltaproteobacteria bacterium]